MKNNGVYELHFSGNVGGDAGTQANLARSQAGNKMGYVPTEPIMQRYGRPWEEYQEARRHYHDTKDPSSKQEMDKKTKEHITDSVETIYDMYEEADPEMKKQIKEKLTALVNNMTAR